MKHIFLICCLLVPASVSAADAPKEPVPEQAYKYIELNAAYERPKNIQRMKDAARAIATTRDIKPPEAGPARAFFSVYVPARVSQLDAESDKLLDDSLEHLDSAQRVNSPHWRSMIGWLFRGLRPIAQENYAPDARVRAINAIAKMTERLGSRRENRPAVPLRYILTDFMPIYADRKNPDSVRVAALVQLHRFVGNREARVGAEDGEQLRDLLEDPSALPIERQEEMAKLATETLANLADLHEIK